MTPSFSRCGPRRAQENAERFFARAGLELVEPRERARLSRRRSRLDGAEVAFLASEIARRLAVGAVHFGITGRSLRPGSVPASSTRWR